VQCRKTPGSIKFCILRLIQTPKPVLPLCKKGLPAPGLLRLVQFRWLTRFFVFIMLTTLCRVIGVAIANHEIPTSLRMWQGRR
jgi:hypothetical protein